MSTDRLEPRYLVYYLDAQHAAECAGSHIGRLNRRLEFTLKKEVSAIQTIIGEY